MGERLGIRELVFRGGWGGSVCRTISEMQKRTQWDSPYVLLPK